MREGVDPINAEFSKLVGPPLDDTNQIDGLDLLEDARYMGFSMEELNQQNTYKKGPICINLGLDFRSPSISRVWRMEPK